MPLLVVCSNNVSILYRFRDITTFTVYTTACDLEKSFNYDETVDYKSRTLSQSRVHVSVVVNTRYIPCSMGVPVIRPRKPIWWASGSMIVAILHRVAVCRAGLLLARLHIVLGGQTSDALWRLASSFVTLSMQRNSPGAARDGGPVVLRPVRARPCLIRKV